MTITAKDLSSITKQYYSNRENKLRKQARELVEISIVPELLSAAKKGEYEKWIFNIHPNLQMYVKEYIIAGGFTVTDINLKTGTFVVKW